MEEWEEYLKTPKTDDFRAILDALESTPKVSRERKNRRDREKKGRGFLSYIVVKGLNLRSEAF